MSGKRSCKYYDTCGSPENCSRCGGYQKNQCSGYAEHQGKCSNKIDSKWSNYLCKRCENLLKDFYSKQSHQEKARRYARQRVCKVFVYKTGLSEHQRKLLKDILKEKKLTHTGHSLDIKKRS